MIAAYQTVETKPTLTYRDIVQGKVIVDCDFQTLPETTIQYGYQLMWYAGTKLLETEDIASAIGSANANPVSKTANIDQAIFKDGVSVFIIK